MGVSTLRIVIPEGAGQLGRTLTRYLSGRGDRVTVLTRNATCTGPAAHAPGSGENPGEWTEALAGADEREYSDDLSAHLRPRNGRGCRGDGRWGSGCTCELAVIDVAKQLEESFTVAITPRIRRVALDRLGLGRAAGRGNQYGSWILMGALGEAWGIGLGLPLSEWVLAVATFFGRTESELLLKSRPVPGRLLEHGFQSDLPN